MIGAAKLPQILQNRMQQIDRHDHVEVLVLAFACALKLKRTDTDQLARARNQRRAAPVWMRRVSEYGLVENVLPIAREFLFRCDPAGERARASARAAHDDALSNFSGLRRTDLKRRKIDAAKRLHQAETGFLIEPERMSLHNAPVAEMQPHGLGFGDQIADGEHEVVVDEHAIACALGPKCIGGESIGGDDRMKADYRRENALKIVAIVLHAWLNPRRHSPFDQRGHRCAPNRSRLSYAGSCGRKDGAHMLMWAPSDDPVVNPRSVAGFSRLHRRASLAQFARSRPIRRWAGL